VTLLLTLLILAVVGLVAAVAAGRITGGLDEPASSLPGHGLPEGRVSVDDLERVRFSPALRGYRMDEVDDVLDRLTEELQLRDEELAVLRRRGTPSGPGVEERLDDSVPGALPWPGSENHRTTPLRQHPQAWNLEPFSPPPTAPAAPPRRARDERGGGR
jgi:DivIVA domain-containing protein